MVDERSENEKRFAAFRERLAKGFYAIDPDTGAVLEDEGKQRALDSTKPWRNELWKAFNQLERDVCPLVALRYERAQQGKAKT